MIYQNQIEKHWKQSIYFWKKNVVVYMCFDFVFVSPEKKSTSFCIKKVLCWLEKNKGA